MMISSVARRTTVGFAKSNYAQIRLMSSMTPSNEKKKDRREIHSTAHQNQADAINTTPTYVVPNQSSLVDRFIVTAEVTVSKIFPAGFGWQTSSIIAENNFGYAPDTMNFALTTGVGDAIGVLAGHMAYYTAKKAVLGSADIDLTKELHTGILLGSAAFCSGTAWQPLVDALQGANLPFSQVFAGTWLGCGAAFYVGLRAARTILSGPLQHIEEPTYENGKSDIALSAAIGGATGFFVGTDAAYLPEQNFLISAVGIQDGTPDLVGCAIAGTSTSLGFLSAQSAMNILYPTGKCWNDQNPQPDFVDLLEMPIFLKASLS